MARLHVRFRANEGKPATSWLGRTQIILAVTFYDLYRRASMAVFNAARRPLVLSPYLRALATTLGILALYGVSFTDRIDFATIVSEPFAAKLDASRQFLFSSPLWFWLGIPFARLLGPTKAYAIMIGIGLCVLALGLRTWLRTLPRINRPAALAALQLSPLSVVILSWLGKSDTMLVGLYLIHASIRRSAPARFVLAAAMVLTHQEIGTVILASDAILRRYLCWLTLAGLAVARIGIAVYQAEVEGLVVTRAGLGISFAGRAVQGWGANPVAHAALGIGWAWLLLFRRRDDGLLVSGACLALTYAASAVVADFTRVTALCALPLIVHLAQREAADPDGRAWLSSVGTTCLCLIQLQIADFDLVHDSSWPQYAVKTMRNMSWW